MAPRGLDKTAAKSLTGILESQGLKVTADARTVVRVVAKREDTGRDVVVVESTSPFGFGRGRETGTKFSQQRITCRISVLGVDGEEYWYGLDYSFMRSVGRVENEATLESDLQKQMLEDFAKMISTGVEAGNIREIGME